MLPLLCYTDSRVSEYVYSDWYSLAVVTNTSLEPDLLTSPAITAALSTWANLRLSILSGGMVRGLTILTELTIFILKWKDLAAECFSSLNIWDCQL